MGKLRDDVNSHTLTYNDSTYPIASELVMTSMVISNSAHLDISDSVEYSCAYIGSAIGSENMFLYYIERYRELKLCR